VIETLSPLPYTALSVHTCDLKNNFIRTHSINIYTCIWNGLNYLWKTVTTDVCSMLV